MKWNNVGHEFDAFYEKHKGFLKKDIYLFGAGKKGNKYADILTKYNIDITAIIDNNQDKQNKYVENGDKKIQIISFDDYMNRKSDNSYIVISVGDKFLKSIISQLEQSGLVEHKDFLKADNSFEKILRVVLMYEKNVLSLPLAQISLTERCTLRCKKCAHACNLVPKNRSDMTLEEAKKSADYFFKFVDYIQEFVLIGGEPFLYKNLKDIIEYTAKYRHKMNIFSITTNGTIIPDDDVLEVCNKYDVLITISNYSVTLPRLKIAYTRLINKLNDFGIKYILYNSDGYWMDYGFDYLNRKASPLQLEKVFDDCFTPCHEIRGSRFYFCVMARSVSENMGKNIGSEDYFDLAKIENNRGGGGKIAFFEYTMGYSKKGYLDMCNYCYGTEAKERIIPVAEQMNFKENKNVQNICTGSDL